MSTYRSGLLISAVGTLVLVSACVTPNSSVITNGLQIVSAGHTGCLPKDNEISIVEMKRDGSRIWDATCKGKVYLCSAFLGVSKSESYSCAPVAR